MFQLSDLIQCLKFTFQPCLIKNENQHKSCVVHLVKQAGYVDVFFVFQQGIANVASVSLEIGYPTVASVPHSIINGFKVGAPLFRLLLGISPQLHFCVKWSFKQIQKCVFFTNLCFHLTSVYIYMYFINSWLDNWDTFINSSTDQTHHSTFSCVQM